MMKTLMTLKAGDQVELIAPASRCTDQHLSTIQSLLTSWNLDCIVSPDIFGDDLLCANTDEKRLELLKNALFNPDTKAVICARGGYGCMRLIPALSKCSPPPTSKIFVGMSDITALNLYLQQAWHWPVIHGALATDKFSTESITALKSMLFGETTEYGFNIIPLNSHAEKNHLLKSIITGGNLCLVQASLGTLWQIESAQKIIFLEEINERGYRLDRMLEHLSQANVFKNAAAILLGDFLGGAEPDGTSLVQPVLERFASACHIPVIQVQGIGHGHTNFPLPMGIQTELQLGKEPRLVFNDKKKTQAYI